jgi:hypothetical protein
MWIPLWSLVGAMLLSGCSTSAGSSSPAVPVDPVEAIVKAFDDHQIVALGEGNHGNLPSHVLRLRLVRNPAFRSRVRDIIVEFGNSRHQDTIDRYVRGEFVPPEELRKVWQDTAQANPVWDVPIYEEFFRAVRESNLTAPDDEDVRVVLGDVPFDWSQVRTLADFNRQPPRNDRTVADIIEKEVISRGRTALLIYGDLHLSRGTLLLEPRDPDGPHRHVSVSEFSIVQHLEVAGVAVLSIYANSFADLTDLQPDTAQWAAPQMAQLRGTTLGAAPFDTFSPAPRMVAGKWMKNDSEHSPTMEQLYDAVLFLGAPSEIRYASPSRALCSDQAYLDMRFFRMELVGMGTQVEQARQFCRLVTGSATQR